MICTLEGAALSAPKLFLDTIREREPRVSFQLKVDLGDDGAFFSIAPADAVSRPILLPVYPRIANCQLTNTTPNSRLRPFALACATRLASINTRPRHALHHARN